MITFYGFTISLRGTAAYTRHTSTIYRNSCMVSLFYSPKKFTIGTMLCPCLLLLTVNKCIAFHSGEDEGCLISHNASNPSISSLILFPLDYIFFTFQPVFKYFVLIWFHEFTYINSYRYLLLLTQLRVLFFCFCCF